MRITVIGGGPGGLYFAALTKKARPDWDVEVVEQNQAGDTFGFGVVFSDETLDQFLARDPETYEMIRDAFAYWDDVAIHMKGEEVRCGGNGFCGTSRHTLLRILQARAADLGVTMRFGVSVDPAEIKTRFADSDVIVACDGVNSRVRAAFADDFRPVTRTMRNRFCWMGSTRPMDEFNYFFRETPRGIVVAHCYQYQPDRSTWVIEMDDACWRGHGLDAMDEEASRAVLEEVFAEELRGHPLLINRSMWRRFPRVFCERWWSDNVVLLGDALATAHFSIGSGTKLAMEGAIALSDALVEHAERDVVAAFEAYDEARRTALQVTQHNADISLAWFEHMGRSWDMEPVQFAMVVMCRAKAITYDNLLLRDPGFVARVDDAFYARHLAETGEDVREARPTPMFTGLSLRGMRLANRVVMSPMAQYMADAEGNPTDWHKIHYAGHATGGMGLVFVEMTCPSAEARITPGCLGMWSDEHERRWADIVRLIHETSGAKIALQLGHAGRKGSTQLGWERMDHPLEREEDNWPLVSASALPWMEGVSQVPAVLDRAGMERVRDEFVRATERAARAGFDMIELHCAHGYLLASFLSPLTNRREDGFGGSVEARARFPLEVFRAMRAAWPEERPMSVRLSGTDWKEGGLSEEDLLAVSEMFRDAGVDLIDVSAGQTVPDQEPIYGRMFQTHLSDAVRNGPPRGPGNGLDASTAPGVGSVRTMAVGNITEAAQVNTILHCRRADLVALGRPHLWNPTFAHQAAAWYGVRDPAMWPKPYMAGAVQAHREQARARERMTELQRKAQPSRHRTEAPDPAPSPRAAAE